MGLGPPGGSCCNFWWRISGESRSVAHFQLNHILSTSAHTKNAYLLCDKQRPLGLMFVWESTCGAERRLIFPTNQWAIRRHLANNFGIALFPMGPNSPAAILAAALPIYEWRAHRGLQFTHHAPCPGRQPPCVRYRCHICCNRARRWP